MFAGKKERPAIGGRGRGMADLFGQMILIHVSLHWRYDLYELNPFTKVGAASRYQVSPAWGIRTTAIASSRSVRIGPDL